MAIKIKDLVKVLAAKDQNKEVEFIVCTTSGELVCMDVNSRAADIATVLKLFGPKKVPSQN